MAREEIPIWEKYTLSIDEACVYSREGKVRF